MFRRIGEYISLDLFSFVNFTSSSLIAVSDFNRFFSLFFFLSFFSFSSIIVIVYKSVYAAPILTIIITIFQR